MSDADQRTIDQIAAGEVDALAELYDRYRALAFAIALRITNNSATAEDVVQEAFIGAWRNAATYDARQASVKTWLLSIVHHRAIDALRRRRPTVELLDGDDFTPAALTVDDAWAEVAARLDATDVRQALETLPNAQRTAIEMAYFDGLTQVQIADRLGEPLGTVKGRVRLGLRALRGALISERGEGVRQ